MSGFYILVRSRGFEPPRVIHPPGPQLSDKAPICNKTAISLLSLPLITQFITFLLSFWSITGQETSPKNRTLYSYKLNKICVSYSYLLVKSKTLSLSSLKSGSSFIKFISSFVNIPLLHCEILSSHLLSINSPSSNL